MTIIRHPKEYDEGYQKLLAHNREIVRKYWTDEQVVDAFDYLRINLSQDFWRAFVYQEARWRHISHVVGAQMLALLKELHPTRDFRELLWLFFAMRDEFWLRQVGQRPFAPFNTSSA